MRARENSDVFSTFGEIYLVFSSVKIVNVSYYFVEVHQNEKVRSSYGGHGKF